MTNILLDRSVTPVDSIENAQFCQRFLPNGVIVLVDLRKSITTTKGGVGSGNFGHEGRPGERGGSSTTEGDESRLSDFLTSDTDRLGPISVRVFRTGDLVGQDNRGIFFAEERENAESYASLHGKPVVEYSIQTKNTRRAESAHSLYQELFGKRLDVNDIDISHKFNSTPRALRWAEARIARRLQSQGFDSVLLTKAFGHVELWVLPKNSIQITPIGESSSLKALPTTWRPWMPFEQRMADLVQSYFQTELLVLRQAIFEQQSLNIALEAAMWASRTEAMLLIFQPLFEELVRFAINRVAESVSGISIDWDLVNTDAVNWSRDFAATRVKDISDTTREALGRLVADGLQEGKTLEEIATSLETMKDGSGNRIFDRQRAELIAITEVTTVFAEANEKAWVALGYAPARFKPSAHPRCRCRLQPYDAPTGEKVLMWVTSRDERVCTAPIDTPWRKIDGCKGLHRMIVSDGSLLGTTIP